MFAQLVGANIYPKTCMKSFVKLRENARAINHNTLLKIELSYHNAYTNTSVVGGLLGKEK